MRKILYQTVMPILFPLVLCLGARAQEQDKDKSSSPAEKQFMEWVSEVQKAQGDAMTAYRSAKTDEERQKVEEGLKKKVEQYAGRFLDLAEKNSKESFAFDALMFVTFNGQQDKDFARACELMLKDHGSKLTQVLNEVDQSFQPGEAPPAGLEKVTGCVLEKGTDHNLTGVASFAMAQLLKQKSESKGPPNELANFAQQAEQFYNRVIKDFADVEGLKDRAADGLYVLRNFSIGRTPPEISGEDGDGKQFKLTDYRGKVVVIDFWANW
jgi:hypothetical protein